MNFRQLSTYWFGDLDGGFVEGFRAPAGVRKPHMQEPRGSHAMTYGDFGFRWAFMADRTPRGDR